MKADWYVKQQLSYIGIIKLISLAAILDPLTSHPYVAAGDKSSLFLLCRNVNVGMDAGKCVEDCCTCGKLNLFTVISDHTDVIQEKF